MSMAFRELPEVLTSVQTRPLFWLRETVPPLYVVGATPDAFRRVGVVVAGSFEGERLSGMVISGNDWQNVRRDNCTKLDVPASPEDNHDDALIVMTSRKSPARRDIQRCYGTARPRPGGRSCQLLFPLCRVLRDRRYDGLLLSASVVVSPMARSTISSKSFDRREKRNLIG